jgi:hypothetical protein
MCTGERPFIPSDETAVVQMIYDAPGGVAENVLHFTNDGGWTYLDLLGLVGSLATWHSTDLSGAQSEDVALREIIATDVATEGSYQVVAPLIPPQSGTLATPVLPSNVTLAVKFSTGLSGRSRKGRAYHIGLGESDVIRDTVGDDSLTRILAAWSLLLPGGGVLAETVHWVVVSYCGDGEWREAGLISAITAVNADNTVDSQRRRLLGRGI